MKIVFFARHIQIRDINEVQWISRFCCHLKRHIIWEETNFNVVDEVIFFFCLKLEENQICNLTVCVFLFIKFAF